MAPKKAVAKPAVAVEAAPSEPKVTATLCAKEKGDWCPCAAGGKIYYGQQMNKN